MSRLHRFILLCLLAVAIPFQSFAAAAMTHCGAAAAPQAIATDRGTDHTDMAMHEHVDTNAETPARSHKGGCSACAACCMVAAPGTAFAPSFATAASRAVDVAIARPRIVFLTGGPERPPRPLLA